MTATEKNRSAVAAQVIRASIARMRLRLKERVNLNGDVARRELEVLEGVAEELETPVQPEIANG